MERSLRITDEALRAVGAQAKLPCDAARQAGGRRDGRARAVTGWSSWPPCSSPSRPSRRPGAATSRPAGTASRRRPAAGRTRCGSSRPRPPASRTRRPGSTSRPSRSGSTPTRWRSPSSPTSTSSGSAPEFKPAVDAWVATRPLKNPAAPPTPFAMPEYTLEARATADRLDAQAQAFAAAGAPRHPARVELRARRRPVRVGAVLRRHEHQADRDRGCASRCSAIGCAVFLAHGRLDRDLAGQHQRLSAAPREGGARTRSAR